MDFFTVPTLTLARAGATEIIQPELEASATVIRHAFSYLKLPDEQVRTYLRGFRKAMDALQEKPRISDVPLPDVRAIILTNSSLVARSIRDAHLTGQFGVSAIAVTKASGEIVFYPPPDMVCCAVTPCAYSGLASKSKRYLTPPRLMNESRRLNRAEALLLRRALAQRQGMLSDGCS